MAVQDEFHVSGSLEFLEDHLVHAAAGLHEGGGDDRERSPTVDVACGPEEPLRPVERVCIHPAGEDLAGVGHSYVVRTRQSRD